MIQTLIDHLNGLFIQSESKEEVELACNRIPLEMKCLDEPLQPGMSTDFGGFYKKEVEYVGMIEGNKIVFYLGEEYGVFGTSYYFDVFFRITDSRIADCFKLGTMWDYNFIKGEWK